MARPRQQRELAPGSLCLRRGGAARRAPRLRRARLLSPWGWGRRRFRAGAARRRSDHGPAAATRARASAVAAARDVPRCARDGCEDDQLAGSPHFALASLSFHSPPPATVRPPLGAIKTGDQPSARHYAPERDCCSCGRSGRQVVGGRASEMDERQAQAPRGTTRLLTAAIAVVGARAARARADRPEGASGVT